MKEKIFGMVSTAASREYTREALRSFFLNTPEASPQEFFLIDNDSSLGDIAAPYPELQIISNESPLGFAANVNQVMDLAYSRKADLYFLNNDLIFTKGWLRSFCIDEPHILSAVSNREFQYSTSELECVLTMDLEDYLGKEDDFAKIASAHVSQHSGYRFVLTLPFYCVKIPYEVYSVIRKLDEQFGNGGGEDGDYCLRASLAGFRIAYCLNAYILHFNGKSTWGKEKELETEARRKRYREVFTQKWGSDLMSIFIRYDMTPLNKHPELQQELKALNFKYVLETILKASKD